MVGARNEASAATGVGGNQADNAASCAGGGCVFRVDGTSWVQEADLKASNTGAGDYFGTDVSVSGDRIVVGIPMTPLKREVCVPPESAPWRAI